MSVLIISLYGAGKENIQKIKDEYRRSIINSLSHDLKTPLTAIIGCTENLIEDVNPEKSKYYQNAIIENATYANNLVNSALELTKTEDIQIRPEFKKYDVTEIINQIWSKY